MRLNHVRRGTGAPLVLLHGIGDTLTAFDPVAELLASHHEVVALDLPGFGRSLRLRDEAPTPQALAGAVAAFMDGARFHVAGNSLGGGIALELARGGHALSACALSPIGFARGWERWWLRTMLGLTHAAAPRLSPLARTQPGRVAITRFMMDRPRPREVLEAGLADLQRAPGWDATVPLTAAYTFTGEVRAPVTVAWGEHDKLLPPWQAARARAALPQARHVILRGCGHVPMWDDPEQVAEAILSTTRSPQPPAPAAA